MEQLDYSKKELLDICWDESSPSILRERDSALRYCIPLTHNLVEW